MLSSKAAAEHENIRLGNSVAWAIHMSDLAPRHICLGNIMIRVLIQVIRRAEGGSLTVSGHTSVHTRTRLRGFLVRSNTIAGVVLFDMSESLLRATEEEKLEILQKYSAFVFDLDGTLWKGTDLVPGASEVLELLRYQVGSRSENPVWVWDTSQVTCHDPPRGRRCTLSPTTRRSPGKPSYASASCLVSRLLWCGAMRWMEVSPSGPGPVRFGLMLPLQDEVYGCA